MQGEIKNDLMEIRTNMQFLSELVSVMISRSMDDTMKRFDDKISDHGVGDKNLMLLEDMIRTMRYVHDIFTFLLTTIVAFDISNILQFNLEVKNMEANVDRK